MPQLHSASPCPYFPPRSLTAASPATALPMPNSTPLRLYVTVQSFTSASHHRPGLRQRETQLCRTTLSLRHPVQDLAYALPCSTQPVQTGLTNTQPSLALLNSTTPRHRFAATRFTVPLPGVGLPRHTRTQLTRASHRPSIAVRSPPVPLPRPALLCPAAATLDSTERCHHGTRLNSTATQHHATHLCRNGGLLHAALPQRNYGLLRQCDAGRNCPLPVDSPTGHSCPVPALSVSLPCRYTTFQNCALPWQSSTKPGLHSTKHSVTIAIGPVPCHNSTVPNEATPCRDETSLPLACAQRRRALLCLHCACPHQTYAIRDCTTPLLCQPALN